MKYKTRYRVVFTQ